MTPLVTWRLQRDWLISCFSTSMESNIVDCDLLEAAKENVQPLAIGRRVTALSELLATPHAQREAKLAATRNRLRINVELALEDEDGDPLEAYLPACLLDGGGLSSRPLSRIRTSRITRRGDPSVEG